MPREPGNLFVGEKGESIFTHAFTDFQFSPNELPAILQRMENTGDDRSFVLVSAVVAERYLDVLLTAFAPGYEELAKNKDFAFSLKIELLRSLRLIPPHFMRAADLIRRVRNELAHNIDCDKLEDIAERLRNAMSSLVRELFGDGTPNSSSARAMFRALCFVVLAGLQSFRTNVVILRETLDQGDLVDQLRRECHTRFMSRIETIKNEKPIRVEDKQGWRYSYYCHGVVDIAPCDAQNPPTTINLDISEVMGPRPKSD